MSKLRLKLIQPGIEQLKGVKARSSTQVFNELEKTDYYANFEVEVWTNVPLEQTKIVTKIT